MFLRINAEELKLLVNLALISIVILGAYARRKVLTYLLCLLSIIAILGYSRSISLTPLNFYPQGFKYTWVDRVDTYDLLHYYLNVKYFKELSYFGLYPSMITADIQNNGPHFSLNPSRKFIVFQDKYDYHWVLSKEFFNDKKWQQYYVDKFTPERWQKFSDDFLFLQRVAKGGLSKHTWNELLWDHGFNGTPAWTASVYWLTNLVPVEYIKSLCHTDTVFLLISVCFVFWAFGINTALIYFTYLLTNYSGRWPTISWAFGRFDYVAFLVIATCLLKKEKFFLGGLFGAWAGSLRIFPLSWFLGPTSGYVFKNLSFSNSKKIFLGGFLITLVLWGLAFFQFGSKDIQHYFKKMIAHTSSENLSSMRAGFSLALAYDADVATHRMNDSRRLTVKSQSPYKWAVVILLVSIFFYLVRKLPVYESFAYGFIPFFLIFTASYYYYIARATLIIMHAGNLDKFRHKVSLGFLLFTEAVSLYLILNYPLHRVMHIGLLSWLLTGYVFLTFYLLVKEDKASKA